MPDKMKCPRCGKRFKQANRKQVFCSDCLAKERQAKKNAPPVATTVGHGSSAAPSAQAAGITIVHTTPPPETAVFGSRAREAERHIHTAEREAAATPAAYPAQAANITPTPQKSDKPAAYSGPAQQARQPRPATQPSERRARPPRPAPFQLTDEMRATIEQRYLDLAQPVEYDGIRTQIAGELSVPKPIVKQVIQELRASRQLPSWWELQAYKGSDEDLERVRERYTPLLPVPPVGVHKQIASELQMDPPQVYQAIRRLRAEMRLPQYNPPESHASKAPEAPDASGAPTREPTAARQE